MPDLTPAGLDVSRETLDRLDLFLDRLSLWNRRINLVSAATLPQAWERHILDSAQVLAQCPGGARDWLDVGTGGGFPGLVCALIAAETAPELQFTLVESDQRKCAFLATIVREFGLSARVLPQRIESLPPGARDLVTARALAPLDRLLGLLAGQIGRSTTCLFPKGINYLPEVALARQSWDFCLEMIPSISNKDSVLLRLERVQHV